MSLHYEWTLSLRLRADVSERFLAELRFHLGLAEELPEDPELEYGWPCLVGDSDDVLPGGGARSLVLQQPYSSRPASLGLFVRLMVRDDELYDVIQTVPAWLAPRSATQGWIGFAREEQSLHPWLNLYVQDGHAYAAHPGGIAHPLAESAPPFRLSETTDLRAGCLSELPRIVGS
ncbi:hypothetical protein AB0B66_34450 [Catellatospora sp. NPDC049111]|uniref:hypothetical protein n=1 Tax=Catellatospora sp. NPDC049111 TaxID=3155271 RepID=UPI0033D2F00F